MTDDDSEKTTRRPRAKAATEGDPPPEAEQQSAPPPSEGGDLDTDPIPIERLLGEDSMALLGATPDEVVGALAFTEQQDATELTKAQAQAAVDEYRNHTVYDSTHLPEDEGA